MIALTMIVKEYTPELEEKLTRWHKAKQFKKFYLQVNGKKVPKKVPEWISLSAFKWEDDFASARNALLALVKEPFWFWVDSDDEIEGLENLPSILEQMEVNHVDRMFAAYDYAKNDQGEEIAPHWRERIIRTSHPYHWEGVVHETLITDRREITAKTEALRVIHSKDQADYTASILRNHAILEREYAKEPRDPRITMYLGMSLFTQQKWSEAIEKLIEHITTSGSIEDQYRSWLKVAECHARLGVLSKSISACMEATKLLPNYPDAYLALGQFYYELEDYPRCLEWLKVGMSKPDPETLAIVDPTLRYRSVMMGALAEFQSGKVKEAWDLINYVLEQSPNYGLARKYLPLFEEAYMEKQAIDHAKWLISYSAVHKGKPQLILESLPGNLALDPRINPERNKVYPPKTWPSKSIVFFCGPTGSNWGPDTLEQGMGGSEEAIVYLSRQLVKQGWQVTVYCERAGQLEDEGVVWLPWHSLNPMDRFGVFVAWRAPEAADKIRAQKVLCDLHDIVEPERIETAAKFVDTFLVKSQYHRELFPNVPDEKFVVISNGIDRSQFEGSS